MVRTVKEATVKAFRYETAEARSSHVLAFVATGLDFFRRYNETPAKVLSIIGAHPAPSL